VDTALLDGLTAYAQEQVDIRQYRERHFDWLWRHIPTWVTKQEVPKIGKKCFWKIVEPQRSQALKDFNSRIIVSKGQI
jgi:hypothetical protein